MIPLHLKLSGFLSYRDTVEVDFNGFDLACISGPNGAGKSSLLDAITWALFGQARKRDEAVVNLQSRAAEVVFTFGYENNIYRVLRNLPRGKTTLLEFQIAEQTQGPSQLDGTVPLTGEELSWRPLTERTLRDTQARIEQILRLDYDTFINVSFFLQGRADQFAQQPPTRRKEILSNILGLEVWETYRERAAERRKAVERELDSVKGRVAEIDTELDEEGPRKAHLVELEGQLKGLTASRKTEEAALENIKQVHAALDRQRDMAHKLGEALRRSREALDGLRNRLDKKTTERTAHADLAAHAVEIEAGYAAWQNARLELEKWEQVAERFREHDQRRQPLLREIESARARLEQEIAGLEEQHSSIDEQLSKKAELEAESAAVKTTLEQVEANITERDHLETELQLARENQAGLRSENTGLKGEMDALKNRIEALGAAEGAVCPLCGQSLSLEHRAATLEQLNREGTQLGDRYRANRSALEELGTRISEFESRIKNSASADADRMNASSRFVQLTERVESIRKQSEQWEQNGAKRLEELRHSLRIEDYAGEGA